MYDDTTRHIDSKSIYVVLAQTIYTPHVPRPISFDIIDVPTQNLFESHIFLPTISGAINVLVYR